MAGRTVLQALLGRLVRMARRDRTSPVDEYVSALWCVLGRYPLSSRPSRIAANLALDTLKAVHRDRRWMGRRAVAVWLAGDDLDQLLDRMDRGGGDPAVLPEPRASDLIGAGCRLRLIDESTSRLLHTVYVDGLSGAEAAARHATTPGSLRVRCSRAVRRLADHASDLAEAA
jgi:DNA-directed RNA polymerase specialized sigma24 family protein